MILDNRPSPNSVHDEEEHLTSNVKKWDVINKKKYTVYACTDKVPQTTLLNRPSTFCISSLLDIGKTKTSRKR